MNLPDTFSRTRQTPTRAAAVFGIALILLLVVFLQVRVFIRANSQTVDEGTHLAAAYSYLVTVDFRLDSEDPPVINERPVLPLFSGYTLPFSRDTRYWQERGDYLTFLPGGESGLLPLISNPNRPWQKYFHTAGNLSVIFFVALLVMPPTSSRARTSRRSVAWHEFGKTLALF